MWVLLAVAAASGVTREMWRPFYADAVDALVHWLVLLPFGLLMAYVLVGRWKKGMRVFWRPAPFDWLRLLVVATLGLLAMRLLIENDDWWRWLFAGIAAVMVTLAALRGVCVVRGWRRRTDRYGNVAPDPYA